MERSLTPQEWLHLSQEVRNKLVEIFRIPRSGFTHVIDGQVQTDGYTYENLKVITIQTMQDFLKEGSPEDTFDDLLEKVIQRVVLSSKSWIVKNMDVPYTVDHSAEITEPETLGDVLHQNSLKPQIEAENANNNGIGTDQSNTGNRTGKKRGRPAKVKDEGADSTGSRDQAQEVVS